MSEKILSLDGLSLGDIEKLAEILEKHDLGKIEICKGPEKIIIESKSQPTALQQIVPPQTEIKEKVSPDTSETARKITGNVIKSPIVGTFYQAPSPDKPPFVRTGDRVHKGDVVMIIESMKLMNEIQSEFDGVVEKILVSDGQPVEFDQPIMIIS